MGGQNGRACLDSLLLEAHTPGALPLPPPTTLCKHVASFNRGAAWHQHLAFLPSTRCAAGCGTCLRSRTCSLGACASPLLLSRRPSALTPTCCRASRWWCTTGTMCVPRVPQLHSSTCTTRPRSASSTRSPRRARARRGLTEAPVCLWTRASPTSSSSRGCTQVRCVAVLRGHGQVVTCSCRNTLSILLLPAATLLPLCCDCRCRCRSAAAVFQCRI